MIADYESGSLSSSESHISDDMSDTSLTAKAAELQTTINENPFDF